MHSIGLTSTIKTNRVNKATHPTDAAALAVELLLVLVIVQFALVAEIFPEQRAAAAAVLLHRLPQPAHAALDLQILFILRCKNICCL